MSTILKALKRLETEKEPEPTDGSARGDSFSARKALHRQSAFSLFRSRLVALSIVAFVALSCIIAVLGWISLQPKRGEDTVQAPLKQQAKPTRSLASDRRRQSSNQTPGVRTQSDVHLQTRQKGLPRRSTGIGRIVPDRNSSHPDRLEAVQAKIKPTVPAQKPQPQASVKPVIGTAPQNRPTELLQQRAPAKEAAIPETSPNRLESPDDPYANAQRLTDGRLKVQAIVWAPEPAERMAVVNNKIVREGDSLEGLFIVGIGREAVYVREDGRLLKVPFGKP